MRAALSVTTGGLSGQSHGHGEWNLSLHPPSQSPPPLGKLDVGPTAKRQMLSMYLVLSWIKCHPTWINASLYSLSFTLPFYAGYLQTPTDYYVPRYVSEKLQVQHDRPPIIRIDFAG
jgi:hypothetical protein